MASAMTPKSLPEDLTAQEREGLDRVLSGLARHAGAVEQLLELIDHLAGSGTLAVLNAFFEEFDENFSALTRPEFMDMVANLMMLLGLVSQISYEPFFTAAMKTPEAVNAVYPHARSRRQGLGLREAIGLLRSPEVAGALETLLAVLRAQRLTAATGPSG
jgi:uncharacterized protein YjgD (DUF1641 family)